MFDHHEHEIIRKLDEILVQQQIAAHDYYTFRETIMAELQAVKDAQTAETQSIVDLAARVAALPQPAATATDLDGLLSTAEANKAAVDAIAPAPTA